MPSVGVASIHGDISSAYMTHIYHILTHLSPVITIAGSARTSSELGAGLTCLFCLPWALPVNPTPAFSCPDC